MGAADDLPAQAAFGRTCFINLRLGCKVAGRVQHGQPFVAEKDSRGGRLDHDIELSTSIMSFYIDGMWVQPSIRPST